MPNVLFYLALTTAFISARPGTAAIGGVVFGLARTLPLMAFRIRGIRLGETEAVNKLMFLSVRMQTVNGVALLSLTAVLLWQFVGA